MKKTLQEKTQFPLKFYLVSVVDQEDKSSSIETFTTVNKYYNTGLFTVLQNYRPTSKLIKK